MQRLKFAVAAACPVIKPGELVIGNNALQPVISGFHTAFSYGIRLDADRLAQMREQAPEHAERLDEIESYWTRWFEEPAYPPPMAPQSL